MKEHWGGDQPFAEDDHDRIGASDMDLGQTYLSKPPRWFLAGERGPRPKDPKNARRTPFPRSSD